MGVRGRFAALFVAVLALGPAPSAQAADTAADKAWSRDAKAARTALSRSAGAGFVTAAEHARYLGLLSHARVVRDRVPPGRARILEAELDTLARAKSPTPSARSSSTRRCSRTSTTWPSTQLPAGGTDITDADGVVYRFFAGQGFAFHPLANGTRLNELIAGGSPDEARALVDALADRMTPKPGGGAVWEYQFDFGNVRAPWTSGMAQAVLAQALARAGALDLARRAWAAIPGELDRELAAGPWIRLYSSSSLTVLNAQLQSAVSLRNYAAKSGDTSAADYAARLLDTAKAMLHRFDTGHWSRYSLGTESTLEYHDYVIDLMTTLGKTTGDQAWTDAAERFELYETQPPELTGPTLTPVVYPWPEDGVRDELVLRFWLSKPSQVALVVDGEAVDGYRWRAGWHTFRWVPTGLGPGEYRVRLVARSVDGQSGSSTLPTVRIERDRAKPELAASKADGRVFWRAKDGESACCSLRLELRGKSERRVIPLERTKGSARIPSGYWLVTAAARDAAGNLTRTELGLVVGRAKAP